MPVISSRFAHGTNNLSGAVYAWLSPVSIKKLAVFPVELRVEILVRRVEFWRCNF